VHQQGGPADCGDVELAEIDDFSEENIMRTIIFYANQTLCTIAHRNFASWLLPVMLIGIMGIKDPLMDGTQKAVKDCQKAGVAIQVIMC